MKWSRSISTLLAVSGLALLHVGCSSDRASSSSTSSAGISNALSVCVQYLSVSEDFPVAEFFVRNDSPRKIVWADAFADSRLLRRPPPPPPNISVAGVKIASPATPEDPLAVWWEWLPFATTKVPPAYSTASWLRSTEPSAIASDDVRALPSAPKYEMRATSWRLPLAALSEDDRSPRIGEDGQLHERYEFEKERDSQGNQTFLDAEYYSFTGSKILIDQAIKDFTHEDLPCPTVIQQFEGKNGQMFFKFT